MNYGLITVSFQWCWNNWLTQRGHGTLAESSKTWKRSCNFFVYLILHFRSQLLWTPWPLHSLRLASSFQEALYCFFKGGRLRMEEPDLPGITKCAFTSVKNTVWSAWKINCLIFIFNPWFWAMYHLLRTSNVMLDVDWGNYFDPMALVFLCFVKSKESKRREGSCL